MPPFIFMSDRSTRTARDLTHLSVQQIIHHGSGRGRGSRSPSPSAQPGAGARFFTQHRQSEEEDDDTWADAGDDTDYDKMIDQPIPADATMEEVRRIAEQARQETQTMRSQQERITAALEAATQAAASATAALQALSLANNRQLAPAPAPKRKRPDLPAFDKTKIHIWIKRVEAAYAREDILDPKQKFAFLESIIGVNMGPIINGFMFGEATQANWEAFLKHLLDTFGPTKQMRCNTFLDGVKRDGRRPTDHLALIRDKGKDVTIDDLEKQLIFRGLPQDVQKLLQDKLEGKSALETAQMADQHFDQQGRPLNSEASICSVNVETALPLSAPETFQQSEQINDVNAVRSHPGRPASQASSNNRYTPAFSSNSNNNNNSRPRSRSRPRNQSTRSGSSNSSTQATTGGKSEMSLCRLHKEEPSSSTCVGPNCPQHHTASSCWSRSCSSHSGQGNGRGGRR